MSSNNAPDLELGRRLLAALISYQAGLSMDYTLKTYVPADVHPSWQALGRALLRGMQSDFDAEICQGLRMMD